MSRWWASGVSPPYLLIGKTPGCFIIQSCSIKPLSQILSQYFPRLCTIPSPISSTTIWPLVENTACIQIHTHIWSKLVSPPPYCLHHDSHTSLLTCRSCRGQHLFHDCQAVLVQAETAHAPALLAQLCATQVSLSIPCASSYDTCGLHFCFFSTTDDY